MARFGAVEQCSDRDAQNGRNLNQPPGSDPVGADLVFLDLLERDAEPAGERTRLIRSHQLHPQIPSDGMRGAREGSQGDGFVLGVEKPLKLSATRVHALGKRRLGQSLLAHDNTELPRDDALDRPRRHLFVDAFLSEEVVKRGSDTTFLLHFFHITSLMRFHANSKSLAGVF
jgi:hypothetical protein